MYHQISRLLRAACAYNGADPARNQHLIKVHNYARMIADGEHLDAHTQFVLEAAAVLHDIGIHEAERIHHSSAGQYQQMEGPAVARKILADFPFEQEDIDRICWLIAHHHTYTDIKDLDYQILVEADFLVNAYEDNLSEHAVLAMMKNIFRTETGRKLGKLMFLEKYDPSQQPDAATM